jgi:hypothetical protein
MKKFRIPYNQHRYLDCSDRPRSQSKTFRAETREEAIRQAYKWRLDHFDTGVTTRTGNRYYIGLLFIEAIQEVKPL